ncbi:MAG: hypothetical protein ABSA86_12290, partial [Oryzomonas sp.]
MSDVLQISASVCIVRSYTGRTNEVGTGNINAAVGAVAHERSGGTVDTAEILLTGVVAVHAG